MKKRNKIRKAKALAAANRRSYLGLGIGLATGAALLVIVLRTVPTVTPEQMTEFVKQQSVRTSPGSAPATRENTLPAVPADALASTYLPIGFDKLSSFPFLVTEQMIGGANNPGPSASLRDQVPEDIKALEGKDIALTGFMMPMKYERGLTPEFLILRSQGFCCYGLVPRITEWVSVRMPGKGVKPVVDQPVTVCGTFHVGDVRENGSLLGIYRLDGTQLITPNK
jgi:hypothetical protein